MTSDPLESLLNEHRIGILDGGLATHLEDALSQSISSGPLWSASLLDSNPSSISQAHRDFLDSGCQILATANYQASSEAYQKAGYDDEKSKELMKSAVTLASQERDRFVEEHGIKEKKPVIALSLGPYGALLQNGSEYTGDYSSSFTSNSQPTIDHLTQFHLRRLRVFTSDSKVWSQIDLIAFETIPRLDEAEAIKKALKILQEDISGANQIDMKPAYLSFVFPNGESLPWKSQEQKTEDQDEDEMETILKTVLNSTSISQNEWAILGVGINCTKPYYISSLSQRFKKALFKIQESDQAKQDSRPYLFLYPDGGLVWDGIERVWRDTDGLIVDGTLEKRDETSEMKKPLTSTSTQGSIDSGKVQIDERARQWSGPLKQIAIEATEFSEGEEGKGWTGVFIGGCCKARTQDIKALSSDL